MFWEMSHLGVKGKNEAIPESFFEITNLVAAALVPHCREEWRERKKEREEERASQIYRELGL